MVTIAKHKGMYYTKQRFEKAKDGTVVQGR